MDVKTIRTNNSTTELKPWHDCDISDLCLLQRGFDITESKRKRGSVPVYSSSGLAYFHNEAKLQPPVVITGRKGNLGEVFFVEEPCWPHDTTLWVRDFKGNDPRFVSYFLGQFRLERFDAATSVPTLNRNNLTGIPISLPDPLEQRAIATVLRDVDALLATLERLITKKRDLKQAAMQQLLTGETRLPGFSGEWVVRRLEDCGVFLKGSGIRKDEVVKEGLPCIRYGEIYTHHHDHVRAFNSFITPETAQGSQRIEKGDLLFAGSGETAEEIGKCVALLWEVEAYAGGDIVILRPRGQSSEYLGYLMNHSSVVDQKARMGQGDAVVHISARSLARLELHLPCLPEQIAIARVLTDMDAELAALEQRLAKTRDIKQGMMQELLTGKTRLLSPQEAHA